MTDASGQVLPNQSVETGRHPSGQPREANQGRRGIPGHASAAALMEQRDGQVPEKSKERLKESTTARVQATVSRSEDERLGLIDG